MGARDHLPWLPPVTDEAAHRTNVARFFAKVDITEACWVWTAGLKPPGYGRFFPVGGRGTTLAARWAYHAFVGPIPDEMTVDHLCFNPPCVNPDHLRLLTRPENCGNLRKARATHCLRGHAFTADNTIRKSNGTRRCRACQPILIAARKARKENSNGFELGEVAA